MSVMSEYQAAYDASITNPEHTQKWPSYWEDIAAEAEKKQDWIAAAVAWSRASGVTLGHNRAARYDEACHEALNNARRRAGEEVL